MKFRFLAALLLLAPAAASANDFPTTDRVEYVLECMKNHDGKHEYLYKCSCAIDAIARQLKYAEYVEVSTAARYQTLGGERGGAFRDPESVRNMAKKFRTIQASANKQCLVD